MYLNLNEILPCFGKKKIRNYAILEFCIKWREQIKTDNFDKNKLGKITVYHSQLWSNCIITP